MNKTKKGALGAAGVGVVALAMFGGGTFATWSDFGTVEGNRAEAGRLVLEKAGKSINNTSNLGVVPGESRTAEFFVASKDLPRVPKASLSVTLQNLEDHENGCSSNSEKDADGDCATNGEGEFVNDADVEVSYSDPVIGKASDGVEANCDNVDLGNSLANVDSLDDLKTPLVLGNLEEEEGVLEGGQGVCVRFEIGLPDDATNRNQGDSASFNMKWVLTQFVEQEEDGEEDTNLE